MMGTQQQQRSSRFRDGMGLDELKSWAATMMQAYGGDTNEAEQAVDEPSMNELLRAAREGDTRISKAKWTDRLRENDSELTRLDLSASLIKELSDFQKEDFLHALPQNASVSVVHLSGMQLEEYMTEEEIISMVESVGKMRNLEELFVFRGASKILTEDLVAKAVGEAKGLRVLMLWGFRHLGKHPSLAGVMRHHPNLERITITLPKNIKYAELDIYGMAFAEMPQLHCLNLRGSGRQQEPVLSPEAVSILLSSKSVESLYLENLGLIDDHTDAICHELRDNQSLGLLDLKDNYFTDDALFTFAQTLPENQILQSLDLSGVQITERGGQAMAKGLAANTTLTHLEIEGTADKYADEFHVKEGHENTEWYKAIDYQLRLNRAGTTGNRKKFVEALNSVSDHLGCLYTFVRQSPHYCDLHSMKGSGTKLLV
mmetsp:Transcript_6809/g.14213  ORF Transcript_6809/g.14213 Transcript_6809/m.14213 type:complete len:429 (-) Transcript_6809:310-1596(-)